MMKSKRLLAIFLTLCMVFTLLPGVALAAEGTNVAKIGETEYATLEAAVDAATAGNTIQLIADTEVTATIRPAGAFTLDLNGHILTGTETAAPIFQLASYGLTVIDTGEIKGKIAAQKSAFYVVKGNMMGTAKLTIGADVTVESATDSCIFIYSIGSTFPSKAEVYGTLISKGNFATIQGHGSDDLSTNTTINICEGAVVTSENSIAIYQPGKGKLNISGGTITGKTAVYAKSGTTTISGGTLNGIATAAAYTYNGSGANPTGDALVVDNCGYPGGAPVVSVTGGTFNSTYASAVGSYSYDTYLPITGFVTGGTFSDLNVINYTADGASIKLGANVALTAKVLISDGRAITLDLNGKTITSTLATVFELKKGTLNVINTDAENGQISVVGEAFRVNGLGNTAASEAILNIAEGVRVDSAEDCCVYIIGRATLNTAGTLASNGDYATIQGQGEAPNYGTVINITGGTVISTKAERNAVYVPQENTMTISGGTITGSTAVYVKSGNLTVSGGTIIGNGQYHNDPYYNNDGKTWPTGDALVIDNCGYPGGAPTVSVTGGTFNSTYASAVGSYAKMGFTAITGFISGGTFSSDPTAYLASGATVTGDATNFVVAGPVAKIGGTGYATLEAAVAAAKTGDQGDTIDLLTNVTLSSTITISDGRAIGLSLNGHTITSSLATAFNLTKGTLNVFDNTEVKGGISASGEAFRVNGLGNTLATDAVLIIDNGVNVTSATDCCVFIYGRATLNTAGILTSNGTYAPIQGIGGDANNGTVINITGGSVTATPENGLLVAIYVPQENTMTISGGTITGNTALYVKSGNLTILGGTFTGFAPKADYKYDGTAAWPTGDALVVDNCGYPGGAPVVSITGGTFNSNNASAVGSYGYDTYPQITDFISGGSYSTDPSAYLQSDKAISTETTPGYFVVVAKQVSVSAVKEFDSSPLLDNTAVKQFGDTGIQGMTDVDRLTVVLTAVTAVSGSTEEVASITYDVTPMLGSNPETTPSEPITFRLAVPGAWTGAVKVTHTHNSTTTTNYYPILGTAPNKYIELSSNEFSAFTIESQTDEELASAGYVARTASTAYTDVAEAFAAAVDSDTITLLKDCGGDVAVASGKSVTLALNGKTFSGSVANSGTLTVTGTGTIAATGTYNSNVTSLIDNELVNCTYADGVSIVAVKDGSSYSINAAVTNTTDRDTVTVGIQVYAGDTVTVNVSVNGGTFVGAAAKLTYAADKFELAGALPTGWETTATPGTLNYYNVKNSGYDPSGTVIGSFTFTAKALADDDQTGTFGFVTSSTYVATAYIEGASTTPATPCDNSGDSATIILMTMNDPTVAGTGNIVYDGEAHSIKVGNIPTGATVTYSISGAEGSYSDTNPSFTNVSSNTVYYKVACDGYMPYSGNAAVNITPLSVAVSWTAETSYTYNGLVQTAPTATFTGVNSQTVNCTVSEDASKSFKDADTYNFTASTSDGNYTLTNTTKTVTISPMEVAVTWARVDNRTYTAAVQDFPEASFTGAASEGTITCVVTKTTEGDFKELGTYSFTASLENTNYTLTGTGAAVTIVMPQHFVETTQYTSGYQLLLVYSDDVNTAYTYDGGQMFNVSGAGYKYNGTTTFTYVFATIISTEYDAGKLGVTTINDVVAIVSYATPLDVNASISVDIRDAVAVQSVYNCRDEYYASYMTIVLKSDVNHDKIVDSVDFALIKADY